MPAGKSTFAERVPPGAIVAVAGATVTLCVPVPYGRTESRTAKGAVPLFRRVMPLETAVDPTTPNQIVAGVDVRFVRTAASAFSLPPPASISRTVFVGILLKVAQGAQAKLVGAHPCGELAGTKAQTGAPIASPAGGRGRVWGAAGDKEGRRTRRERIVAPADTTPI